ncbi:hypothetical protein [Paractinoplanes atraurantiacus]|uniref:Uncharacterized protein n=1 Tax=Paractinoplanes atraurantiacus TaxID=1036182 RepID=A0A285IYA8_9ACTN|nr:hypothetical protein [Actinoplanes atraurantiacus]SNY53035.1 hypothetical protein SAMN05421748_113163 [Actinoplanes atraurantiacus]
MARTWMPLRGRLRLETEEATASGIYGLIVGAAVLVAGHGATARAVVAAVIVTLVIYWAAERYARIVAERIHQGHRPAWHTMRKQLTSGWELVSASILPLLVLLAVKVTGASLISAELASLATTTVLLCMAGWRIGSGGRLTVGERVVSTLVAGMFGAGFVLLKTLLH